MLISQLQLTDCSKKKTAPQETATPLQKQTPPIYCTHLSLLDVPVVPTSNKHMAQAVRCSQRHFTLQLHVLHYFIENLANLFGIGTSHNFHSHGTRAVKAEGNAE
jgi:hypothetical protein